MSPTPPPPELSRVHLGYIPLTDAAPLVVALERGHFARYGLDVTLARQASWATLRDKLAVGHLDGAHLLAPMALACMLSVEGVPQRLIAALSLGLGGNAITVADNLYREMQSASASQPVSVQALAQVIARRRAAGADPLTFATVYPTSNHTYLLRYWLAAGGIDPDRDIRLVVVPPPQMVQRLRQGDIFGYCVGEPWNSLAVHEGIGCIVATGHDVWNNAPEKVLAVSAAWAQRYPGTHAALIAALVEAGRWLDESLDNRREAARLLAGDRYLDLPLDVVTAPLIGQLRVDSRGAQRTLPEFHLFYRHAATFPWRSHALWMLHQMQRWGQSPAGANMLAAAYAVYRPDIYRLATARFGLPVPAVDMKAEGGHGCEWRLGEGAASVTLGPDRFIDGAIFDPADVGADLAR